MNQLDFNQILADEAACLQHDYIALPETNSSHLKLDAWKMFLGFGLFSGMLGLEK